MLPCGDVLEAVALVVVADAVDVALRRTSGRDALLLNGCAGYTNKNKIHACMQYRTTGSMRIILTLFCAVTYPRRELSEFTEVSTSLISLTSLVSVSLVCGDGLLPTGGDCRATYAAGSWL